MKPPHERLGNKLSEWDENPVDRVFLRASAQLTPWFHRTGHSPNHITTYSFACGVLSIAALVSGHFGAFLILFLFCYLFDCADGQMARRYDRVTVAGDWYDHLTDLCVLAMLACVCPLYVVRSGHSGVPFRIGTACRGFASPCVVCFFFWLSPPTWAASKNATPRTTPPRPWIDCNPSVSVRA